MKVVIVGAGVGGLVAARKLRKGGKGIEVTLIDRSPRHDFQPSFLWLMVGKRKPEAISRPLEAVKRWGVDLVQAEVDAIDRERGLVQTAAGDIPYDKLILSPGAELDTDSIPGLAAEGHIFYNRDGAERLRDALAGFNGSHVLVSVASMPYKCPAAPYEAAFLIEDHLRRKGVKAKVDVITAEPQPMPVAGPEIGKSIAGMLHSRGIGFKTESPLEAVDGDGKMARFKDGSQAPYDLLVVIPPHKAPSFVPSSGLAGEDGWIAVDPGTMAVSGGVYAIGDVTSIPLANGKKLPKAGVFAHSQAEVVASNIVAGSDRERFNGNGKCFLEIGAGKAGFASGDFYAKPAPSVRLRKPGFIWHLGKALFEKQWLRMLR